ncbi:MAG TPA: cytochrome c oxidase subunit II, partial [Candidatus Dormibacteraeota bacterium]|nr:cytochrome c oxidase subunit II [Candidatus Dormibacteraeota bacterium]
PENLSIFDPVSPPAFWIRDLLYLVLGVAAVIFVLVEGMLLYSIFRFRHRESDGAVEPPQIYGSKPIEIAWTLAPLLIVFVLFLVTVRSVAEVRPSEPPKGAMTVQVIGHQWWWEYQYPQGFKTANELHVPIHTPIECHLLSVDVIHSFWIPRLAGKTDVVPNHPNRMWFEVQESGLFLGHCAEFCGTQHANMMIRVVVQEPEDFEKWVENQRKPAMNDPTVRAGRDLFLSQACVNCHTVRSTRAAGTFGPDLTHLMSRATLGAGVLANSPENLRLWIQNPAAFKPGCEMPAMSLNPKQLGELVAYLETLK